MKLETVALLKKAANELNVVHDIHDKYSGRGMGGKTTYGIYIAGDHGDLYRLIAHVGAFILKGEGICEREQFVEEASTIRTDTLGYNLVAY